MIIAGSFRLPKLLALAGLAGCLSVANASLVVISQPDAGYQSSTTEIPITGVPTVTTTNTLADSNVSMIFTAPTDIGPDPGEMEEFSVPSSWSTWGSLPNVESTTPNVLSPVDFLTTNSLTLTFSTPLSTFGMEVEPDADASYGAFPVTLDFYDDATLIGSITNDITGDDATLFAASSTIPITSVVLTIAGKHRLARRNRPWCCSPSIRGGYAGTGQLALLRRRLIRADRIP